MSKKTQIEKIELNGTLYNYTVIKRRGIKNIRLRLENNGMLKITLPWFIPKREAKIFLLKSVKWIEKNFNTLNLNKNKYYYLGNEIKIVKKNISNIIGIKCYLDENIFNIESTGENIINESEIYHKWLKKKAEIYILSKVNEIAQNLGLQYSLARIKNMRSRWGSCSSKKNLSFNLKLIYFKPKVIEYVIVHELCHLKEMNHSKNFWNLVESIMPNYKTYRKELKKIIL